jgi:hypothetical protein
MGECSHDSRAARARDTIFRWHKGKIADFVAQPLIGYRFDSIDRIEIGRIRDILEQ